MSVAPILRLHRPEGLHSVVHVAMATEFVFWLGGHEHEYLTSAAHEAFSRIDEIESKLSLYREGSDVARINLAMASQEIRVSEDTLHCLEIAREAALITLGAFSPFMGGRTIPLKHKHGDLPLHLQNVMERLAPQTEEAIIEIEAGRFIVRKRNTGGLLDLGAIGKGFALDRAAECLREWGVTIGCLIAGGSSVLVLDPPSGCKGFAWEANNVSEKEIEQRMPLLANLALGASGFGYQGEHIINPFEASDNTMRTQALATAKEAAWADALSTAAMILPDETLMRIAASRKKSVFIVSPFQREESRQSWRFVGAWT